MFSSHGRLLRSFSKVLLMTFSLNSEGSASNLRKNYSSKNVIDEVFLIFKERLLDNWIKHTLHLYYFPGDFNNMWYKVKSFQRTLYSMLSQFPISSITWRSDKIDVMWDGIPCQKWTRKFWTWKWVSDLWVLDKIFQPMLTHLFPMHPFSTRWKHQKTVRFSDVFRGQRRGALGTNALTLLKQSSLEANDGNNNQKFC